MSILSEEDQKILKLIYSGTPPNDLLVLEIIKNRANRKIFVGALINICICTLNNDHAREIYSFLKPYLSSAQEELIIRIAKIESQTVRRVNKIAPTGHIGNQTGRKTRKRRLGKGLGSLLSSISSSEISNYRSPYFQPIAKVFPKEICFEIALTSYYRSGECYMELLAIDDGTHTERENIFQRFLTQYHSNANNIIIPGLQVKEMSTYLKPFTKTKNPRYLNRRIYIYDVKSNDVSELLFKVPCQTLIVDHQFTKPFFPEYIFRMTDVKNLQIHINENTILPKDWSNLTELRELTFRGEGYVFHDFDFINSLPKLTGLYIHNHKIASPSVLLRKKKVPIESYIKFVSYEGYNSESKKDTIELPQNQMLSIATALAKSVLTFEEQEYYLKKILALPAIKKMGPLPVNELIALMNVSFAALRNVVQNQLHDYSMKQKGVESFNSKSTLYIAGTPSRKKTEIKQKLKTIGIKIVDKPEKGFTHLLVGKNPKDYKSLQEHDFEIISEQELNELFKTDAPGYLEEAAQSGNVQINDNVLQFLYNDEVSNVLIGLEMLKNGGVPDELIDPLLVVYKSCPDTKARKIAKQLLDRHASAFYIPLINDTQRFTNLNSKVKAQEVNKKLEKIAKGSSPKHAAHLSLHFHKRFKKGLRYILYHFKKPCEERPLALKAMMEGTHFDFAAGVGFKNWKEQDPSSVMLFNMRSPARFPIDVADHVPLIENANFHNCKFTSLPTNIGRLKHLKKLDLSHNFLGSIPKSIEAMTSLEHLDLQMNQFKTFPSTLKRLTNLKVLDLRYNRIDNGFSEVEVPDDVRKALKGCEILL
ncbi:MAG: BRCT domain-containing protein [Saprospiraceae bacterium]